MHTSREEVRVVAASQASESPEGLSETRARNNPNSEPTGHFTGRCAQCGSKDIWDDNLAYGCNSCNAFFLGTN